MPTIYSGDANPTNALSMKAIATIELAGAEISAYDPVTKRVFVTSNVGLQVIDLSDPAAPVLLTTIQFTALGFNSNDVTSVAVKDGVVAVAIVDAVKTNPGKVALLDAEGALLGSVNVGALPDMLTFTPDGSKVLVANEGEPLADENGLSDPVGRISIIDLSAGPAAATVVHAGFSAFDDQQAELAAQGVRFDAGKTVSQAIEPEYIAISPDGTRAIITLQENNAFAILDLTTNVITEVRPLGTKDFSDPLSAIDASDRDGGINIQPWSVKGMYMPDAIASFTANGQTYYVTANEGDGYEPFGQPSRGDVVRLKDLTLDPTVFPNAAELQADEQLGRLNVSSMMGDIDGDGDYDEIYAFGARSFSIWDASGNIVFDSGNVIERATALLTPDLFNANDGVASAFDGRSDDKGAEPEGLTVGQVDGKTYVFVGLERAGGGVMAFDITDPANVQFAQYALNPGDVSPEGITFIDSAVSPSGKGLLAVTNEVSSTLTIYEVEPSVTEPFKLQLLHFADAEAGLLAADTAPILGALIDRFDDEYANTLVLSGGDNFIPGPFLAAGTDPSLNAVSSIGATAWGRPDIAIINQMGVDVSAIGNHEWDLGSAVYADATRPAGAWVGAQFAMVSANLDFSADSAMAPRTTAGGQEASSIKGLIAPWVTVTEGGEKIGILGATTQILERISSPSGTEVNGFPKAGEAGDGTEVDDMALLASQLQPIIDEMIASGINKIILTAHLQNIENEKLLATLLTGVDIILAAGSNTRLGDANDVAAEFPGHAATFADGYPLITAGADGSPTLIVNTDNEYTYLGRLVVEFDDSGVLDISALDDTINGAYASTQEVLAQVYGEDIAEAFAEGSIGDRVSEITQAVDAVIADKDGAVFGYSDVYLEGERNFVRSQETNLGNLAADAQLSALAKALGDDAPTTFMASLKNGGGIRAQIGSVVDTESGPVKSPTLANPDVGKAAGAISQLDIENSLRFNNGLMALDLSSEDLLAILEYGVGGTPPAGQGRFPQIGGVSFSWDPTQPVGQRVSDVALIDDEGGIVARIADDGQLLDGAPDVITVVTLNFLANGGDGYPFKTLGENFRFLLDDGTLSASVDPALDFTAADVVPANMMKEQQNFQEYMLEQHGTPETAFTAADTGEAGDTRIQNITAREDTVLEGDDTPPEDPGEVIEGTGRSDRLVGTEGDDTIFAFRGNDVVRGGDGNDDIDGGDGSDRLYGEAGDDLLFGGSGNDTIYGGDGHDFIDGGNGTNRLYGGEGDDTIDGGRNHDYIEAGAGADVVTAGRGNDRVYGGAGDDVIDGGAGHDKLFGEDGDDEILGDVGNDYIDAGAGDDFIVAGSGNDRIYAGAGDDMIDAGAGNDTVEAGAGSDFVEAGSGNDRVYGGAGDDVIEGGAGNDRLYGDAGDDLISGGDGADYIYAGLGDDILSGGSGRDVFYFENGFGQDTIEDFEVGLDRVNMRCVSGLNSFADLVMTQEGQDLVIAFNGNTITLLDVSVNDIDRHDVIV